MNANADDPELLSVAGAVADGTPVNWDELQPLANPERSTIINELRAVARFRSVNEEMSTAWGPFAIIAEIGRGAFGRVYRAADASLRREVALKVIRSDGAGAPIDLDHALTEARLLARISHPNVVRVYRAERIGDEVGIVMELVKGHTLEELVHQRGPFSANEAILIGLDLCRAVAAVHATGTLHGDIKARNIMREPGGRTVLMDFGAGRDLDAKPPAGGDFAGTPVYLAPEVFAGQARTKASDIYSLGVLLYFLVTQSYPVHGSTGTEIGRRHGKGTGRRRLRDVRPDLPDGFVRVVERMLASSPAERYESAGALEVALSEVLSLPIPTPRPQPTRKALILAAAAAAILAAVGVPIVYRALAPAAVSTGVESTGPGVSDVAGMYRIEAALYAERDGGGVRVQHGALVAPGDRLSLEVQISVPAHVYVVNEDEQGESYLLFPLPGQSVTNPLRPGQRHRLPGVQGGQPVHWQVTSAGGREHFLIFASPEPSPAFERLFASLPTPTLDKPIQAARLSPEALGVLRGVGGLTPAASPPNERLRLARDFATPLVEGEETVRGVWIRQITLDNPGR